MHTDPRIDAYVAKAQPFARPILTHLRGLIHKACPTVEETIKWSFPHFLHRGILCSMGSFKQHCMFCFWHTEMRKLKPRTGDAKSAMGQFGKITSLADLPTDKQLAAYLRKAIALNESPIKSTPRKRKP